MTARNELSLRQLEIFGTLMLHRTMVETAGEIGVSQPAVSIALRQLETELGFALFERRGKRLLPTEEARSLFREIEPVFRQLRSVEAHARELRDGTEGILRMIATAPLGNAVVPGALKRFLAERPNVAVQYDVARLDDVIEAVEIGSAEIGLVLGLRTHPAVSVRTLHETRMVALVPPAHPLAGAPSIDPAAAAEHGFIGLDRVSRLGQLLQGTFVTASVEYAPRVIVRNCHTAAVLANAGMGLAVVDPFTASFLTNLDLVRRPFEPGIPIGAGVLSRPGAALSRVAHSFVDVLDGELGAFAPGRKG